MINLYQDQQEVLNQLKFSMRKHKSILLQSATGSGKTAIATYMAYQAVLKGNKVLFTVPRTDLMNQTSKTFNEYGVRHSFIAPKKTFNPFSNCYIGMVESMARRLAKLPKVNIVIIDETHFGLTSLDKIISHYKKQNAWIIGLSATPAKLCGQGMGIWYEHMVLGKSIRWLMDNGRLSDYRYFYGKPYSNLDLIRNKSDKDICSFMEEKKTIIGDCVKDYRDKCMGRLHIVRCTSIKHSELTAQAFRDAGIPAMHVDGKTPEDIKDEVFMDYATRKLLVLTFADLLNFGFDLSQSTGLDVCIESGDDMKPSHSLAGQMQFWGRMLRKKPDSAIILDRVNNYLEHGLPCADRNWTLDSKKQSEREFERVPPTKQCPECFYVHSPSPECPECKHIYEVNDRKLEQVDGEMQEINKNNSQKEPKIKGDLYSLEYLIDYAKQMKYKNPAMWASKELAKRLNEQYK